MQLVVRGEVAALPLKGVVDLDAECARLEKEMPRPTPTLVGPTPSSATIRISWRARREEVVDEQREQREEAVARKAKFAEALERSEGRGVIHHPSRLVRFASSHVRMARATANGLLKNLDPFSP